MSQYSFEECTSNAEWDNFNLSSPQGSIFNSSEYLDQIGLKYKYFVVKKGSIIHGGITCLLDSTEKDIIFDETVIYTGPLFAPNNMDQNNSKRSSFEFEVTDFIVKSLALKFNNIAFQTSTALNDLRAFQWYNYGLTSPKYNIDIRYTTFISLDNSLIIENDNSPLFMQLGTSRRQEIRYALKDGIKAEKILSPQILINLYKKTLEKNNTPIDEIYLSKMEKIISYYMKSNKYLFLGVKNKENEFVSVVFFLNFKQTSYYMWGASLNESIDRYSGTIVVWEAFKQLKDLGINLVDLEGVNSPRRGWFKLSFGGTLKQYYSISLTK